jgi:hypothetical protein
MRINSVGRFVAIAAVVFSVQGCGGSGADLPETVPVTGKVIFKGAPLTGAAVRFYREGASDRPAVGTTDSKGVFNLTTFNTNDGAQPGPYKVTILMVAKNGASTDKVAVYDPSSADMSQFEMPMSDEPESAIPAIYASPASTPLKQTVTESGPNDFKLEIE